MLASKPEGGAAERAKNHVLAALPEAEYQQLAPHLRYRHLDLGFVCYEFGQRVEQVYFPTSGLISLVLSSREGVEVEVGMIGHEGVASAVAALTDSRSLHRVSIQIEGDAFILSAERLREAFRCGDVLQDKVLRHMQTFSVQTSQCALCNCLHSIEARLARWLLMIHDRVQSPQLDLTQEFIAQMLGARRPSVTVAAGALREAGVIDYKRGHIVVLDRAGLEQSACECYAVIRDHSQQITPTP